MSALCEVATSRPINTLFYLCICLFIDEEDGNALAVGCAALERRFVDSSSIFDY